MIDFWFVSCSWMIIITDYICQNEEQNVLDFPEIKNNKTNENFLMFATIYFASTFNLQNTALYCKHSNDFLPNMFINVVRNNEWNNIY